ncbi:MAG: acyltransferase [Bacteroidales bacterium]|nr:acyltransferase [Bacteroidales bacterium]
MKFIIKLSKYLYFFVVNTIKWYLFKIAKNWVILNRIHPRLRPSIWRSTGCKIGKGVSIGYDVYYDVGNSKLITIEDNVWVTSRVLLLCHKRDLSEYFIGDDINKCKYLKKEIILKKGCHIGMGSIILPGVIVGEGAIVGAGSIVTKNVSAWTIVAGNPAVEIKKINNK